MTTVLRPAAVLTLLCAVGLAACGGSKGPGVASLSGTKDGTAATTTTLPHGSTAQLLDEWASCIRQNGIPTLSDPTVNSSGTIVVTIPSSYSAQQYQTANGTSCQPYLASASKSLGGDTNPGPRPNPQKLLAFSECMRANGVANFPDPSNSGIEIQGSSSKGATGAVSSSGIDPQSPTFQAAQSKCSKKEGLPAFGGGPSGPGRGSVEVQGNGFQMTSVGGAPAGGPGASVGNPGAGGGS